MATRKKAGSGVTVKIDSDADLQEDLPVDPDIAEADEATERAGEEVPTRARAMVYRKDLASGKMAYLYELDGHTWTQEQVAKECGGGDYEVIVRGRAKGAKGSVARTRKMFTVDHSLPRKAPPIASLKPEVHEHGEGGSSSGDRMQQIFESGVIGLLQQQNALTTSIMESIRRPEKDWSPVLTPAIAGLVTLLTAVLERGTKKEGKDPIETAREIAALIKEHAGETPKTAMEQLKEILEVRTLFDGEQGATTASPETQLIGLLGPKILEIMSDAQKKEAGQLPAPPAVAVPAPAPAALPPPQPEAPLLPAWLQYLGHALTDFKRLAQAGKVQVDDGTEVWVHDPELYANVLLDQLPPEHLEPLRSVAESPTFDAQAFGAFPAMGETPNERTWFVEFLNVLAALVTEEGAEPEEVAPGPGDTADATVTDAPEDTP